MGAKSTMYSNKINIIRNANATLVFLTWNQTEFVYFIGGLVGARL